MRKNIPQTDQQGKIKKNSALIGLSAFAAMLITSASTYGFRYIRKLERKIIFNPMKKFAPMPESLKGIIQNITTVPKDCQLALQHYYVPAKEGKKTVIFCHGNIGNTSHYFQKAEFLYKEGYGSVLAEYRGYGKNKGTPTEKGLYNDVQSVIDFLKDKKVPEKNIILWGFSLGGSVATEIAKNNNIGGLILNNTFTSTRHLAKEMLSHENISKNKFVCKLLKSIPTGILPLENNFNNLKKIKNIKLPILILHTKDDSQVPYRMAERLHKTNKSSILHIEETGEHTNTGWVESHIREFIKKLNS